MALLTELLLELVALVGAVILIGFLVLFFRNPYRARWSRTEFVQMTAPLVVVCAAVASFAAFASGLSHTGFGLFAVLSVTVSVLVATVLVAARLFRFRERLERADTGQNPFDSMNEKLHTAPQIEGGYR